MPHKKQKTCWKYDDIGIRFRNSLQEKGDNFPLILILVVLFDGVVLQYDIIFSDPDIFLLIDKNWLNQLAVVDQFQNNFLFDHDLFGFASIFLILILLLFLFLPLFFNLLVTVIKLKAVFDMLGLFA